MVEHGMDPVRLKDPCLPWEMISTRCTNSVLNSDKDSGGRLNKKDRLTRYGDSHVKDKTS